MHWKKSGMMEDRIITMHNSLHFCELNQPYDNTVLDLHLIRSPPTFPKSAIIECAWILQLKFLSDQWYYECRSEIYYTVS